MVTVTIPNTDTQTDLNSWSRSVDTLRKVQCLDADAVGGQCVESPCPPCDNDSGFTYYIKPGDLIPLQYRLPDTMNADPQQPDIGWRQGSGDYWLEVQLIDMNGAVIYAGDLSNIAASGYVAASAEVGNYQNAILSADKVIAALSGQKCFVVRVRVRLPQELGYTPVDNVGEWDLVGGTSVPTGAAIGDIVMNNEPGQPGFYELQEIGWVLVGMPENGDYIYNAATGEFMVYSSSLKYLLTAHGAGGAGSYSFSVVELGTGASEVDTELVSLDPPNYDGGIVLGLRTAPDASHHSVALLRGVNRWNGIQSDDNAESVISYSVNDTGWSREPNNDSGPFLLNDTRNTRVAWARRNPQFVVFVEQGYPSGSIPSAIYISEDYGDTWTEKVFGTSNLLCSIVAWNEERMLAGSTSGALCFTDDAGDTWTSTSIPGLGSNTIVGHLNGVGIIAVGQASGMYAIHANADLYSSVAWSEARSFPDIGAEWRCTDILQQGLNVWVFGFTASLDGVLFRSQDNGATWEYMPEATVLGGRACIVGFNTLAATAHVFAEVGDVPAKAGTVYLSEDGGETWAAVGTQPSGGAEALDGMTKAGIWNTVDQSEVPVGEAQDQFQSCDSYPFRVADCNTPTVRFRSGYDGIDCSGYYHGTEADYLTEAFDQDVLPFAHDFRVKGSAELDELQTTREVSENGRFLKSTSGDRVRVRTAGLPESVARRVQTVLASPGFTIDGKQYDEVDTLRKNNDDGGLWWLDFRVSVDGCSTEASCE